MRHTTEVVATTMADCYQAALERNPLVGEQADLYMEVELREAGFKPTVITEEDFGNLLVKISEIPLSE